jgi:hypothetical protein
MATLLGFDAFDDAEYFSAGSNELYWHYIGYTAIAGTVSSLKVRVRDGTATSVRMGIYDSAGNLVVETDATSLTLGSSYQTITASVTPTALSAAKYYIGIVTNNSLQIANDSSPSVWRGDKAAHTFGALPSTISPTEAGDVGSGSLFMWADGTVGGGGSIVPQAMANYRMRAA